MNHIENPKPSGISRRTVAKGIAWSVPAVAVATAAPAYAASPGPIVFSSKSCKDSSGSGANTYYFVFETTLQAGTEVTVDSWKWVPNDDSHAFTAFTPVTTSVTGEGQIVYAFTDNEESATNGELTMCFSWAGVSDHCVSTGTNNYSSCGNSKPVTSKGTGATFPATKEWPNSG